MERYERLFSENDIIFGKHNSRGGWLSPIGGVEMVEDSGKEHHEHFMNDRELARWWKLPINVRTEKTRELMRSLKEEGWIPFVIAFAYGKKVLYLRSGNNYDDLNREQKKSLEKLARKYDLEIKME